MPSFDIHISGSISSSCFRSEAKHLLPEVVLYMGLLRLVDHNRTNLKGMLAYPQCLGNVCTRTTVIEVGHKAVAPASHILNPLVMSPRLVTRLFAAASHACPDQPSVCHAPRSVARLLLRPATCLPRSTLSVCHVTKVSHKAIAPASHQPSLYVTSPRLVARLLLWPATSFSFGSLNHWIPSTILCPDCLLPLFCVWMVHHVHWAHNTISKETGAPEPDSTLGTRLATINWVANRSRE